VSDVGGARVGAIAGVALLWAAGLTLLFFQVPDYDYSGTVPLGQDLTVHVSEPGVETFVWIFRQHHDSPVFRDLRFQVTSPVTGPLPVSDPPHAAYRGMPDGRPYTVGDIAEFRVREPGDIVVHVDPRKPLPDGTLALVPSPTVSHPLVPRPIALAFFAAVATATGCLAVAVQRRKARRRVNLRSNVTEPAAFIRDSPDGHPRANTDSGSWQAPP